MQVKQKLISMTLTRGVVDIKVGRDKVGTVTVAPREQCAPSVGGIELLITIKIWFCCFPLPIWAPPFMSFMYALKSENQNYRPQKVENFRKMTWKGNVWVEEANLQSRSSERSCKQWKEGMTLEAGFQARWLETGWIKRYLWKWNLIYVKLK